jgi:hypothetical protein
MMVANVNRFESPMRQKGWGMNDCPGIQAVPICQIGILSDICAKFLYLGLGVDEVTYREVEEF